MKEQVEAALEKVRPALQRDGGDVELVEVTEDGVVKVRLQGACKGCPMAQMTLQMGIERVIKEMVPDVKTVEAVAGTEVSLERPEAPLLDKRSGRLGVR